VLAYCFFSFAGSSAAGAAGVLLPLAALPLGEELGALLELEPPDAESFFVASADAESFFVASADEEALEDGELGVVDAEPDAEPEGELGVVEPADEELEPGVVLERARSSCLSQPVSMPAPSARETATAKAESLICGPPWVGVKANGARNRPVAVPC